MSSKTKDIGLIGEQVIIAEFVKRGIPVLKPLGDNLPYDFVVVIADHFYKIQVKTTLKIKNGRMIFATNITNPFRMTSVKYTKNEIDYFGLYCIENGYIGLMSVDECSAKDTVIRLLTPKNNQESKVKMADVYAFDRQLPNMK